MVDYFAPQPPVAPILRASASTSCRLRLIKLLGAIAVELLLWVLSLLVIISSLFALLTIGKLALEIGAYTGAGAGADVDWQGSLGDVPCVPNVDTIPLQI